MGGGDWTRTTAELRSKGGPDRVRGDADGHIEFVGLSKTGHYTLAKVAPV